MSYVVGTAIDHVELLTDGSGVAITGATSGDFTTLEAYLATTPATTAAITLTEIGQGEYLFQFTPSVAGTWRFHAFYDDGVDEAEFAETFVVGLSSGVTIVVSAATTGAQVSTLAELRREVADRFDDLVQLTATANGNVGKTTLIDTYHVNDGTEHFNGRDLLCTSGANATLRRRVTGTVKTTGTLTLNAALTAATAAGDTFEAYNRQGRGFTIEQYTRAINFAIRDAYPTGMIDLVATISGSFSALVPEITIPPSIVQVTGLEYEDAQGFWFRIPPARAPGGEGWYADAASGQLRLHGTNAWLADTLSLRVFGFGRQGELSAESDTCALSPKFIVAAACYKLAMGSLSVEEHSLQVNMFRDEMERYRVTLRRFAPAGVRKNVRAA